MVFLKVLEMSKTNIMIYSSEAIDMIIRRYQVPAIGVYDTVKSTPSRMDYPSANVLD